MNSDMDTNSSHNLEPGPQFIVWAGLEARILMLYKCKKHFQKNAEKVGLSEIDAPKRKETRYDVVGIIIHVYTKCSRMQFRIPAHIH